MDDTPLRVKRGRDGKEKKKDKQRADDNGSSSTQGQEMVSSRNVALGPVNTDHLMHFIHGRREMYEMLMWHGEVAMADCFLTAAEQARRNGGPFTTKFLVTRTSKTSCHLLLLWHASK